MMDVFIVFFYSNLLVKDKPIYLSNVVCHIQGMENEPRGKDEDSRDPGKQENHIRS